MNEPKDERTGQFREVVVGSALLIVVHVASVVMAGAAMIGEEYGAWVCVGLPLIALGVAGLLAAGGRWHWGRVVLFGVVVLLCSGFQLVLIGMAGASV
jgi:hypothetical protein